MDDIIIEASHFDVLVARIDEVKQVLQVQNVLQRKFQAKEWKKLDGIVDVWMQKIQKMRELHAQMDKVAVN